MYPSPDALPIAGGKIGMPKQLVDGAVEYPDGTPSTESQMAKVRERRATLLLRRTTG